MFEPKGWFAEVRRIRYLARIELRLAMMMLLSQQELVSQ